MWTSRAWGRSLPTAERQRVSSTVPASPARNCRSSARRHPSASLPKIARMSRRSPVERADVGGRRRNRPRARSVRLQPALRCLPTDDDLATFWDDSERSVAGDHERLGPFAARFAPPAGPTVWLPCFRVKNEPNFRAGTGSGANVARIFAKHYKLTTLAACHRICSEALSGSARVIAGGHRADSGAGRRRKSDMNDITT